MRNKPTRFYSSQQEKKVAKAIGGKTVANSGAANFVGGDVKSDNFLVECKTTIEPKKSFSIKQEWLDKIEQEAVGMHKQGFALCFEFNADENKRYYIISEKMFKRLNRYLSGDE